MDQVYVGLDLGSSVFQQVTINASGAICLSQSFPTSEANLRKAFADLKGAIHVHLEAGELAPWVEPLLFKLKRRSYLRSRLSRRRLPGFVMLRLSAQKVNRLCDTNATICAASCADSRDGRANIHPTRKRQFAYAGVGTGAAASWSDRRQSCSKAYEQLGGPRRVA